MAEKIGFIGLGQMGRWMAGNILQKGFELTVSDIDRGAVGTLKERGAKSAAGPAGVAECSDWIFLSLPDTKIVQEVVFGKSGLLTGARNGQVVIDLGTTDYMATLEMGARLKQQGVDFADAPVSGMEARARDGTLTVMYGGDKRLFERVGPVFDTVGNLVLYMGELGSGQLAKLINQLLFDISAAAIAEIFPMAVKLGLDPEKVVPLVNSGTGRSFASEFFGPRVLENNFREGYALRNAYKDLVSAAQICAQKKVPLPMVHAATTTYQMALSEGYGEEDKGAMIKVFERLLGVEFRKKRGER